MSWVLLFVDDHPLYREGVRRSLLESFDNLKVHLAEDETTALDCLSRESDIDLVLADQRLAKSRGIDLLDKVGASYPTIARGLLCAELTQQLAAQSRASGCVACLDKRRDTVSLAEALNVILSGGTVFDAPSADAEASARLSERRLDVVRLAAQGRTNKEIGREMGISERTVKDHWSYIFASLGVSSRAEAVSRAYQLNLM